MSFDAGAIVGSIDLDIGGLTSAIAESAAKASLFPHIISEFMEHPLLMLTELAHEAADAIVELVEGVTESQHELANTAKAIGVSVSFLDGWRKAAKLAGASSQDLSEAMVHLSRSSLEALRDRTGDTAKAFRKLGIDVRDGGGHLRPVEELARAAADGLHDMQAGAERTGLAMEIFGRGAFSTLAFLSQGSIGIDKYVRKLKDMGAITGVEAAEQATAFEDMIQEVKAGWEGIKLQLAEPIRDALRPMLENLLNWMHTHPAEIQRIVQEVAARIVKAIHELGEAAIWVKEHFDTLIKILGAAGLGVAAIAAVNAIGSIATAVKALTVTLNLATAAQIAFNAAKWGGVGAIAGALAGGQHPIKGAVGGTVGGLVGGVIGQSLIPVPGVGWYVGQAVGGLAGGYAASHDPHAPGAPPTFYQRVAAGVELPPGIAQPTQVNVTVTHAEDAPKKVASEVEKKMRAAEYRRMHRAKTSHWFNGGEV